MPDVCLYFQVHQPGFLKRYTVFDIGQSHFYEDAERNRRELDRFVVSCCLPVNAILLRLIKKYRGRFRIAMAISGPLIDLLETYRQDVLEDFKKLADEGFVEFMSETCCHSFAALFSLREFREQLALHKKKIHEHFGQNASTFRCTESLYNNKVATIAEEIGYSAILAEERFSGTRSPAFPYYPAHCTQLKLLLRNDKLSDEIKYSGPNSGRPLTVNGFVQRMVHDCKADGGNVLNLFMDYETFRNNGRSETKSLEFIQALPAEVLQQPDLYFSTPSDLVKNYDSEAFLDVPDFSSNFGRSGNAMQRDALRALYDLEESVRGRENRNVLATWRMLQESEHFYYMNPEEYTDGAERTCFNPYASPYEAYINYMNILDDFSRTLQS